MNIYITYWIIHLVSSLLFIYYGNQVLSRNFWDDMAIVLAGMFGWPLALLICIAYHPLEISISNPFRWLFKRKRKIVPGTYYWYLWWEVVTIDWDTQWIVIGDYINGDELAIVRVNTTRVVGIELSRITSTQKVSELAEELSLYKQSKDLEDKATALIEESKLISEKAMKLRKNVLIK